jgi:PPOX class probable F420-dependent enzyme
MELIKDVHEALSQTRICVLSTTGPGDWPHSIPMWYRYRDGIITFTTSSRSQKFKNVERIGKATVVIDDREPPYYAVMIRGDAEIGPGLTRDEEYEVALRYLGEDKVGAFMALYDAGGHDDATINVHPTKVAEFQSG